MNETVKEDDNENLLAGGSGTRMVVRFVFLLGAPA